MRFSFSFAPKRNIINQLETGRIAVRFTWTFLMDGALLGFGLAMDAFSVSVVNGLRNPAMNRKQRKRPVQEG
jgi:hypothetical protein